MSRYLTIDFGSTYTKAAVFDLEAGEVVGTGYAPSTVGSDVRVGLWQALEALGDIEGTHEMPCYACSSAAGGLRIVVVGLVPSLSLEAARRAALGAGGKVVGAYGHKLTDGDCADIKAHQPDILILAGGTDGGDEGTILHNAAKLAELDIDVPVIVAGNKVAADECGRRLKDAGMPVMVTPNLLPRVDHIEVDAVHEKIRETFMERIIHARGIDLIGDEVNLAAPIVPTPRAILDAAVLLSDGYSKATGLGDVVVVDVGGATTDVHSVAAGAPRQPGVIVRGLPELHAKRTVEGDLGMRISAATVMERVGAQTLQSHANKVSNDGDTGNVEEYVTRISSKVEYVPANDKESCLDAAIAMGAVDIAMTRHAGWLREVQTATGKVWVQEGKDLTGTEVMIGVGGVFAFGQHSADVLRAAFNTPEQPFSLRPEAPSLYVDRQYLLFGIGLLSQRHPQDVYDLTLKLLHQLCSAELRRGSVSRPARSAPPACFLDHF